MFSRIFRQRPPLKLVLNAAIRPNPLISEDLAHSRRRIAFCANQLQCFQYVPHSFPSIGGYPPLSLQPLPLAYGLLRMASQGVSIPRYLWTPGCRYRRRKCKSMAVAAPKTISLPRRAIPPMARIRQHLPAEHIGDVRSEIREKLLAAGLREKIRAKQRIAITAGSRGIGALLELLLGIADAIKGCGAEPFVIPAMGSHGGATAQGQREILQRLGISDDSLGVPVLAGMETRELGTSESGAVAHIDKLADDADGIIVLGRTKTHPESAAELASGLLKMCTVGLGKQHGAQQAHNHGLWESVRAVPKLQLAKCKILFGVSVVENGYRRPCVIEVVPPRYEAFLEADMRLLRVAKQHLAKIPFDELDLLIVDELGKTISGAGMDPNVIGHARISGGQKKPHYKRIVVLSLTHASLGNGLGIGMADFTTRRFAEAYDPAVSYMNLLTASEPGGNTREGPLPLALPSDREAIEVALFSALPGEAPRVCRIHNTAELGELWVSEALLREVEGRNNLEILEAPRALPFDTQGNLLQAKDRF